MKIKICKPCSCIAVCGSMQNIDSIDKCSKCSSRKDVLDSILKYRLVVE